MWGKIIGGIMIISGAWGVGISMCQDLKASLFHITEQSKLVTYMEREIDFLNSPLEEVFYNIRKNMKEPYTSFLEKVCSEFEEARKDGLRSIWNENVNRLVNMKNNKSNYYKYLYRIGECIGCDENKLQVSMLLIVKGELEEEIKILKESLNEKMKLIKTLSLLAGIFCVVLLV